MEIFKLLLLYSCLVINMAVNPLASGVVPALNEVVEKESQSSLLNIWRHALREQDKDITTKAEIGLKTIVSPNPFRMINLTPQCAAHPLYHNSESNVALRTEFLLDYLVLPTVLPDDPEINQGVKVQNLFGNDLIFKKIEGKLMVNDIPVEEHKILSDGTQVYVIESFLFDHQARVTEAFHALQNDPSMQRFGPMGRPLGMPLQPPAQ